MKIAVVTDDEKRISAHFGRARHFLVFNVENGHIVSRELRNNPGPHHSGGGAHHGRNDPRGHGFGSGAHEHHQNMIGSIQDCDVVVSRGMGRGIYLALQQAGIQPIVTEYRDTEDAVHACIEGTIVDRPERLH